MKRKSYERNRRLIGQTIAKNKGITVKQLENILTDALNELSELEPRKNEGLTLRSSTRKNKKPGGK